MHRSMTSLLMLISQSLEHHAVGYKQAVAALDTSHNEFKEAIVSP